MSEKIYISKDGKRIEAKGKDLEQIISAQADAQAEQSLIEAEQTAKAEVKASALAKLTALGLSEAEVKAIIGE